MQQNDLEITAGNLLRKWRLDLGYTQKELAELLGVTKLHIYAQERNRAATTTRTINHLALIYAVQSLPPDAPVSVLKKLIKPQSARRHHRKHQKARQQA